MHVATEGCRRADKEDPWGLLENPQDPESYIQVESALWKASRETGGFPSFFATKEFEPSARLLGMKGFDGDQGPYGHAKEAYDVGID